MELKINQTLERNPEIINSKIDDEVVMMSIEDGKYYGLDNTGSQIWNILESPQTISHIITQLMDSFDVSEDQCLKDCIPFIEDMLDKNILLLKNG